MRAYALSQVRRSLGDGREIEFTQALPHWRSWGRQRWAACRRACPTAELPADMPDYLLDRYAFRCAMQETYGVDIRDQFAQPPSADRWLARTRDKLRGADSNRIGPVDLAAPAPDTQALHDLLARWRDHLLNAGATLSPTAFSPLPRTWLQVFRSSVLVPFYPPAILGPSFLDRVSDAQRRSLIDRYATHGILELYTFLVRSHEETHREQRGEPMACELLLAMLWCSFLDAHDQWHWQRNDATGVSLNLEEPFVRRLSLPCDAVAAMLADTATGVTSLWGAVAYDELCLCAWLFDARVLNYRGYLDLVTRRLRGGQITDDILVALRRLDATLRSEGTLRS
jgi:hypothetical protein